MRTIALLSFLSLWTEMAAVHAGDLYRDIVWSTADHGDGDWLFEAHEVKEGSARPGDSVVSGDFLPLFGFISVPKYGGHLYEISGSVASYGAVSHLDESFTLFESERHFISRCALPLCTSIESGGQHLT
eukprot:SAG31_NODE_2192_length_6226_cov_6.328219_5_plen_129_part_00